MTIPEALIDFFEDSQDVLPSFVAQKLKSLRTRYRNSQEQGKTFKLSDYEIKKFRGLFLNFDDETTDSWNKSCTEYLGGKVQKMWDTVVSEWNLNFLRDQPSFN